MSFNKTLKSRKPWLILLKVLTKKLFVRSIFEETLGLKKRSHKHLFLPENLKNDSNKRLKEFLDFFCLHDCLKSLRKKEMNLFIEFSSTLTTWIVELFNFPSKA